MDNLKNVTVSMNANEFIDRNELHIDEEDVKEKAILELENLRKCVDDDDDDDDDDHDDHADAIRANENTSNTKKYNKLDEVNANEPNFSDLQNNLNDTTNEDNEAKARAVFAFTIDFNDSKVDNKKHKEIFARFQSRQQQQMQQRQHRRDLSLSKLDESARRSLRISPVAASTKPPVKEKQCLRNSKQIQNSDSDRESQDNRNVHYRRRAGNDEPTLYRNRHSWSPSTSMKDEIIALDAIETQSPTRNKQILSKSSFVPKSSTLQKALETAHTKPVHGNQNKLDVLTAPLEYVRLSDDGGSADAASDAGTYTLDGDHYTEEEKERMSIDRDTAIFRNCKKASVKIETKVVSQDIRKDKMKRIRNLSCGAAINTRSYAIKDTTPKSYYSSVTKSPNASHIDKMKSRVKTTGDNVYQGMLLARSVRASSEIPMKADTDEDNDVGTFTSVTACGVLNKSSKPSIRINRKNSLTMLQIDASEYIQPNYRADDNMMKSYTDYEKAKQNEYQLNIFSPAAAGGQQKKNERYERTEKPTSISIKTAPTKNDWIQEWARNARRRNILMSIANGETGHNGVNAKSPEQKTVNTTKPIASINQLPRNDDVIQSYDKECRSGSEFGDDVNTDDNNAQLRNRPTQLITGISARKENSSITTRPPASPTKIPSPIHSAIRMRGNSANRSFKSSFSELDKIDTEMYLEKTAEAISSLNKIHRNNTSPNYVINQRQTMSPMHGNYDYENAYSKTKSHKRNLSLDDSTIVNPQLLTYGQRFDYKAGSLKHLNDQYRNHSRRNSYDNKLTAFESSGLHRKIIDQASPSQRKKWLADQQNSNNKYGDMECVKVLSAANSPSSPIRRSTSFSAKQQNDGFNEVMTLHGRNINRYDASANGKKTLCKSASSSSFKKMVTNLHANDLQQQCYSTNDESDFNSNDYPGDDNTSPFYMSDDSDETTTQHAKSNQISSSLPISHTRYNKAFLMRIEQSKQMASAGSTALAKGVIACPNTPEMPRRNTTQRASFRDRASMPRDSSLSRIKMDLPSMKTMKKTLTEPSKVTNSTGSNKSQNKVLPKYLDISKYKSGQGSGQTFLRRDESKSTLINRAEIRKSPSAIGLSKTDSMTAAPAIRIKSAGAKLSGNSSKESKAREAELAMWRRRATYDPMKAAAQGRKKLDSTKKGTKSTECGAVLRSQSFHSGVGQFVDPIRSQFSESRYNSSIKTESLVSSEDDDGVIESS